MEELEEIIEDVEFIEEVAEVFEMPPEEPTRVYVEVNQDNNIVKVFSSDFEQPTATSIKINEGFGDRFRHAQSQYFDKPLINDDGGYNYAFIGGKIVGNN